jgi:hypothetical protein
MRKNAERSGKAYQGQMVSSVKLMVESYIVAGELGNTRWSVRGVGMPRSRSSWRAAIVGTDVELQSPFLAWISMTM